jgi:hypothetical protein
MPDPAALDMGTNTRFQPALSATSDRPTPTPAPTATPASATPTPVADAPAAGVDSAQAAPAQGETADAPAPSDAPSGADPAAEAKPKGGFQKRIDELTKQREEFRREKDEYARRLDETLKIIERQNPPARTEPRTESTGDAEPVREQYETPDEYAKALSQWSTKRALSEYQAAQRQQAEQERAATEFQKVLSDWHSAKSKAIEKYPDYESVAENPDIAVAQHVGMALLNVPNGHDVLYWLGRHPTEASRISGLQPPLAVLEVGRLSERLALPAPTSKAPAPTKPLAGHSNAADRVAPEDDPGYMDRRLAEMRTKKR